MVAVIAKHCQSLVRLKLDVRKILVSFERLWTSLGKTLARVELGGNLYNPMLSLQSLFTSCPNISGLSFAFVKGGEPQAIEDVCKLYGARLKELKIRRMSMDPALVRIGDACPNVLIDFPMTSRGRTETVISLGRAAKSWTMHPVDDIEALARLGLSCPNLRSISRLLTGQFGSFSASSFGGLFAQPKPMLKYLDMSTDHGRERSGSDMSIVLNVLADRVDSLESFSCEAVRFPLEPLLRLLRSQKELKTIWFRGSTEWNQFIDENGNGCIPNASAFTENLSLVDPDFGIIFQAVCGRNISILICGVKIQG